MTEEEIRDEILRYLRMTGSWTALFLPESIQAADDLVTQGLAKRLGHESIFLATSLEEQLASLGEK